MLSWRRLARLMLAMTIGSTLIVSGLIGEVSAQPRDGGGVLVGRVVLCRDAFSPVGDPSVDKPELLEDVPGPGGGHPPASMLIPIPDVLMVVDGTTLSTRTDDNGRFTLMGVPTARPLSLSVFQQPNTSGLTLIDNVVVDQGQTLDLGQLVLGGGIDQSSGGGACSV